MLKAYQPIRHKISGAHKLLEFLVLKVWCKADNKSCESKLNANLKALYDNSHIDDDSFKKPVKKIYSICKGLSVAEIKAFKKAFVTNNKIKELCNDPSKAIPLATLNNDLADEVIPFFKTLYKSFMSWKFIKDTYGTKKEYYDKLITKNGFKFCPCCGFGTIKTIYDKGHSPYDHYLPLKHYPFSVVNFKNLVPLCTECNSDYKGETDILKAGKKVFYPINSSHIEINIDYAISSNSFRYIIIKTNSTNKLSRKHIEVLFNVSGEEINSWDSTFDIKSRYFGQVANNRESWLNDVRETYRDSDINTPTFEHAFDKVIKSDANKYQGFLKSPYLNRMKSFSSLIEAMEEVTGDYRIQK